MTLNFQYEEPQMANNLIHYSWQADKKQPHDIAMRLYIQLFVAIAAE
ncbi:MAG: hypothetical protein RIG77_22370 [Cyclobacteriaceae bacterium]